MALMSISTSEKKARDMLGALKHPKAQEMSADDLVELANAIQDARLWRALVRDVNQVPCRFPRLKGYLDEWLSAYLASDSKEQAEYLR
jgi:hypothetical protein